MSARISKEPRVPVMAHVPVALREKLVAASEASGLSLSSLVAIALEGHFQRAARGA